MLAFAFTGDCRTCSYRTDLYDRAPETWADVVDVAKEYTDPARKRFGWVFSASGPVAFGSYMDFLFTFGGRIYDDDWRPAFNGPEGVEALEFQLSLMDYTPPGIVEFGLEEETQAVARGEVAGASLWPFSNVTVYDSKESEVADRLAATRIPRQTEHASLAGAFVGAIPKGSKNPEGAARFIKWFTAKERQIEFARAGFMPMRTSAFEDSQARETLPYLEATQRALATAQIVPPHTDAFEVIDAMNVDLSRAYARRGEGGAKSYLDRAAERVTEILDRAGYYST